MLNPIWKLTFEAARRYGLRVGFRIQMSSPEIQPLHLSVPDFIAEKVPYVKIGRGRDKKTGDSFDLLEPRYDHPVFMKAFRELNELLAAEFDGLPEVEFMDLMMYGFWGEGHTHNHPNPFPDYYTAQKTFLEMTQLQLDIWKKTPLVVNTQPDISRAGNRTVQEAAVNAGCWLRTDSILVEEPMQIEMLGERPPWLPSIIEDGHSRHYRCDENYLELDEAGVNIIDKAMLHSLDVGANYWALWTEADNLKQYFERYPDGLAQMKRRMGYRLRPAWVWQRKVHGAFELITAIANDGVAGVPGTLKLCIETFDGRFKASGTLDKGQPYAGKVRQASFIIPAELEGAKIKLKAELDTGRGVLKTVNWACSQPLEEDGAFTLVLRHKDDNGWRKGI